MAECGEDPLVKIVPANAVKGKKFKAGALKGRLFVPNNFLDPDPEFEALFYDGPVFPADRTHKAEQSGESK